MVIKEEQLAGNADKPRHHHSCRQSELITGLRHSKLIIRLRQTKLIANVRADRLNQKAQEDYTKHS